MTPNEILDGIDTDVVSVSGRQEPGTKWPVSCGSRGAWFCAETHYGQDERAVLELGKQQFTAYLPTVWERRTKGERVRRVKVPMFPGYVFVQVDPFGDRWGSILYTRGVRSLIQVNNRPARLPDAVMTMIAENAVELNREFEEAAAAVLPAGTRLRATKGPWAGFEGVCLWHRNDRIRMMMSLFGREAPVEFPVADLELVKPGASSGPASTWRRR